MNIKRILFNVTLLTIVAIFMAACGKTGQEDKLNLSYEKYTMPNGLQVVLHQDHSDPVISFAIMYHVGSSRETPRTRLPGGRTGEEGTEVPGLRKRECDDKAGPSSAAVDHAQERGRAELKVEKKVALPFVKTFD